MSHALHASANNRCSQNKTSCNDVPIVSTVIFGRKQLQTCFNACSPTSSKMTGWEIHKKKISGKSGNHHGAQSFFSAIHVLLPEGNLMIAAWYSLQQLRNNWRETAVGSESWVTKSNVFCEKQSQLMTAVEQNLPIIVSLNHVESTCLLRRLIPVVVSHMCDGQNSIHVVRSWRRFTRPPIATHSPSTLFTN